jgi:diguanylate cyclase (GGDEF)-like protein/PAS domain S-box-containing protein
MIAEAMSRYAGRWEPGDGELSVLLVEDNPADARLVEEHLRSAPDFPTRVRWVRRLEEGLAVLEAEPADVVLLDLNLPDSEGVETVRRLVEVGGDVPLLVLTGQEDPGTAVWALRAGADEYVYKGELTSHVLSRAIRFALERREMAEQIVTVRKLSQDILSSLQAEIAVLDADGTILSANDTWHRFAYAEGGRTDGYVGENYLEVTAAADDEHAREALEGLRSLVAGETSVFTMEYPCHAPDERRWFRLSATPLEEGGVRGVVVSHTDVTRRRLMEEELRRSQEQLATVFELSPTGIIVSTPEDGVIQAANRAALEYHGASRPEQLVGKSAVELGLWVREEDRARVVEAVRTEGEALNVEAEHWTLDGERRVGLVSARRLELAGEDRIVFVVHDISDRKRADAELRESEERYRTLFEDAQEAIAITRPDGSIADVNPTWHELFGHGPDDIAELQVDELYVEPEERTRLTVALEAEGRVDQVELRARRADGSVFDCLVSASVRSTGAGEVEYVSFLRDISERKRFEEELRHQALHDVLTGLPNRGLLNDRLEQAVARARRGNSAVALLFVDVDRFKAVNDSFGHEAGDKVLITLARELEGAVREEDTVARFGGDEFVVLAEGLRGPRDAVATAERLVETLRASPPCDGAPYHLTASVGVAVCGRGAAACTADEMLRQADIAMYRAKGTSGITHHLFDPREDGAGLGRMQREKELRRALEEEEFVPVYQPVVGLEDGETWGVEMLARWDHPERGRVGPGEFIPLAEESGLILTLDRQLLDAGLRDFAAWRAAGGPAPARLLVNLSASQFEDPAFPAFVASKLEEYGVPPAAVHFEVTETEIMQSTERIRPLAALGVRILIDDFGTGYSSLGYLREMDVDGLKVDMSFVQGITEQADDRAIVETILTLGDRLGLEVIAEGIETEEQHQALWAMGCRLGQGYLFARPMDAGEVVGWLAKADRAG